MPKFIYFIPITLILHACGGGDISTEETIQYELEQKALDHSLSTTGAIKPQKTIMPVSCVSNPSNCS